MKDENIVLCNVPMLLSRSKNVNYKESVIRSEHSLASFLYDNGLLVDINPFNEDGELKLDLVIRKRNVTDEGYELFKQGIVGGWYNYLDRSIVPNKYENISRLEKGLKKIRETSSPPPKAAKAIGGR